MGQWAWDEVQTETIKEEVERRQNYVCESCECPIKTGYA